MSRQSIVVSGMALLFVACSGTAPPQPQWTVVLTTDAPVPQFGNRVLVDVLDDSGASACLSCQRQLGADNPSHWPISFGIAAFQPTFRVRARLFRASLIGTDGIPAGPALIDRVVSLPPTTDDLRVEIDLPMGCFGVEADVPNRMSCDPATGALAPEKEAGAVIDADLTKVGTWPAAASVPCSGPTPADMVCIHGGAFIFGDPVAIALGGFGAETTPEHLVQLSPFRIDREELTVQDYLDVRAQDPKLGSPQKNGSAIPMGAYCSYEGSDPTLSLNCITQSLAQQICAARGKRLPTEAEWEYAAGNLEEESAYPWGSDSDVCDHAILARSPALDGSGGPFLCRTSSQGTLAAGPTSGGAKLDLTTLGVHNLAGNLSEWVADAFAPYTDPCWSGAAGLLVNPTCTEVSSLGSVRGGSWAALPIEANVVSRLSISPISPSPLIGLRCASD